MSTTGRSDSSGSQDTFAIVLAGGNGTRLGALTRWQCKPAIPFAAHFRNIDFTLSNCINSGLRRIAVLTQYKAQTLITHLGGAWSFLPRALGEFAEVWPAQQRVHGSWYAGTADAVFQNLDQVLAQRSRYTLVLAGDHIYKMDYRRLIGHHIASGCDVTVGCVPVPVEQADAFGVIGVDERGRVQSFVEKPPVPNLLATGQQSVLASMGIYVFTTDHLAGALTRDAVEPGSSHDFGRDVLPAAVREHRVSAHVFTDTAGRPGYWRDVGTLESYWQAHMDLLAPDPPIELYDPSWPIHTAQEALPPARLLCDRISNSIVGSGSVVRAASVSRSVLSTNVAVGEGAVIEDTVVLPNVRIGANCRLHRAIIDSDVEIPDGTSAGWSSQGASGSGRINLLTRDTPVDNPLRSVA